MNSRIIRAQVLRGRTARVLAALAVAALFAGCEDSSGPQRLVSLAITPAGPVTLAQGAPQSFTVTGIDNEGDAVTIDAEIWSVANPVAGTINSSTGAFTAGTTAGTFIDAVVVTCNGITARATVIVLGGPLASIVVTPNPGTMAVTTSLLYTASGRDASNNTVPITGTVTWSVVNGGGTIPAGTTGLTATFTAGSVAGTFSNTVRATNGTLAGTATAIVTVGPLFSIVVTPNPATMQTNATQQFTAEGRDAGGNVVPIPPPLVWSVDNPPGGGTINATTGLFTAGTVTGTFTDAVRATSGIWFDDAQNSRTTSGTATVIVTSAAPVPAGLLGTASTYGILAGTTVTCITGGVVNADIGISPGSALVGFGPCVFTGVANLANAAAAQAQLDLTAAYNALFGLPCPPANAIVADLGGTTKPAGVYCTASGIGVTGTLTLDGGGDPNATFVFQAGTSLVTAGNVVLINGAQAKNVWWQVGTSATLGTASQWQGSILALSSITMVDNATLIGRALARNGAVTLGTNNVITLPAP